MNLLNQRRLASKLLKCGINRVWIDPDMIEEVSDAVTRADIRNLINQGIIKKKQKKGISRGRIHHRMIQIKKGRQHGHGSRKGSSGAKNPKKERWMRRIRAIRKYLKELRKEGKLNRSQYRKYYNKAKGGEFKSRSHLKTHLLMDGVIKE